MKNRNNSKAIDFLIEPENVSSTLEILSYREAIYGRLLNEFWTRLIASLRKRAPDGCTAAMKEWSLDPGAGRMDALDHSGANSSVVPWPKAGQALFYRIQQRHRPNSYHLFFGLIWAQPLENKAPISTVAEVAEIRKYHADAQFNMQGDKWYCGWTNLFPPNSRDVFISEYASERSEMTDRYADRFWTYVDDTRELVTAANKTLQGQIKRFRRAGS